MRKLLIATIAGAGVFAAAAPLASANVSKIGPPGTVIKGSIANCKWKLQGGELPGKVAYTRLWYLGPRCKAGRISGTAIIGGEASVASCRGSGCPLTLLGNFGFLTTAIGKVVVRSAPSRRWEGSTASVCGAITGGGLQCEMVFLTRPGGPVPPG